MKKTIEVNVSVPTELDKKSVEEQIFSTLIDYIEDKATDPEGWKVRINGRLWS